MTIKNSILGIDVGSVAAGIVLIKHYRRILHEGYAFHHGAICKTLGKRRRKYVNLSTYRALLAAMSAMEKDYMEILQGILQEPEYTYDDDPAEILARYDITPENTGESMDNILKIHYLTKHHPDMSLLVQASPALCCASLITEAMKVEIEQQTGIPVVSITHDGTGGFKNDIIVPYLKFSRTSESRDNVAQDVRVQSLKVR